MKNVILSAALAAGALGFSVFSSMAGEGPVPSKAGTFNSPRLIDFEEDLDRVEEGFAQALAKGGDPDYESLLAEFETRGNALQKEVLRAGLLEFVEVRNEVNAITDAYFHMKAALEKGENVPLVKLISTKRRNRCEGSGPSENWSSFSCEADLSEYYAPYEGFESKGFSRVSPNDLLEAIGNLRQMIGWLERSGCWNVLGSNGNSFVLKDVPRTELAALPKKPEPEADKPSTQKLVSKEPEKPKGKRIEF
jgi:hypothetical protein